MDITNFVSKKDVFVQKIDAYNFGTKSDLINLKKHKGQARILTRIKLEEDEEYDFFIIALDYQFIYKELPLKIELNFECRVDFDRKLDSKPKEDEIEALITDVIPLFDEKITKVNNILDTKIPKISKVELKGSDHNEN